MWLTRQFLTGVGSPQAAVDGVFKSAELFLLAIEGGGDKKLPQGFTAMRQMGG
ncbi:hypothetical protein ACFSW8_01525 [Rubritalea tangerina]|uniref:Uncharacterized protein n=2 Tax=Rubritalea tangerina TaxID=430798 RepID=A0ABW4Z790_9BACT